MTPLPFDPDRIGGRKIYSAGRLIAGGETTVEASGMFIRLSTDRVMKMLAEG